MVCFLSYIQCLSDAVLDSKNKIFLFDLLNHKEVTPRSNATLLLTKLLACERKKDVTSFLKSSHLLFDGTPELHLANFPSYHDNKDGIWDPCKVVKADLV